MASASSASSAVAPAAVAVTLNTVIGMRLGAPGALAYVDEQELQYVAGRGLVRYDLETRQQRTVQGAPDAIGGITAVATTPNRRTTAYAELGADGLPVVSLVEWAAKAAAGGRRKKVRPFLSLSLSLSLFLPRARAGVGPTGHHEPAS